MRFPFSLTTASLILISGISFAQQGPPPERGPGGDRPGPTRGGGGDSFPERKILEKFDTDKNGRLETAERTEARDFLKKNPIKSGRRGPPRGGDNAPEIKAGKKISPDQVKAARGDLYAENILRTLFIDFENDDWESELEAFNKTDVDVPATLRVDGKTYAGVGLHFRGQSSYFKARKGQKRSLNLSIDHTDAVLRLDGYKTLNLNNAFGDASLIGASLYSHIARSLIPAPKVNLVRIVINGEYWGVYQNQQQFDKDFLKANFDTKKGTRWKAPGSPRGDAGLQYLGEELAPYQKRFEMKSGTDADWKALVHLCKVLDETPANQLEKALAPILDVEGVLRFLALDCTLMNSDGYWTRASDYYLYRDPKGIFHVIPHDMNEALRAGHSRRGPSGPRGAEPEKETTPFGLDPLVGLDDKNKALRSKLLAVPALKKRYLAHCEAIARDWLDWKKLGPLVASYHALIETDVAADTRKNGTTEAFLNLTASEPKDLNGGTPYRTFADGRRKFLLNHPAIKDGSE